MGEIVRQGCRIFCDPGGRFPLVTGEQSYFEIFSRLGACFFPLETLESCLILNVYMQRIILVMLQAIILARQ